MKCNIQLLFLMLPILANGQYSGTASVTQGPAVTTISNLYTCPSGRIPALGTITATDNSTWTVPAEVRFADSSFPFASDLYNSCNGSLYANSSAALSALSGNDIHVIDSSGELITAFIFADNYFEMYINGVPVGKDNVPYTQFNSNIVRFRVNRPFTISMLLVDWEENLGLGSENSNGFTYHDGDGGMVAVFKNALGDVIAITDSSWKAQAFYTSPITDLTCPSESGQLRLSNACSTQDSNNGSSYYGLHWTRPSNWESSSFNDSAWPNATLYSNATIGVNNKPAYTNFTDIFDDPNFDAQFIWSTNVILDNEVIVRYTVDALSATGDLKSNDNFKIYPNPSGGEVLIEWMSNSVVSSMAVYNSFGNLVLRVNDIHEKIRLTGLSSGLYFVQAETASGRVVRKLIIE